MQLNSVEANKYRLTDESIELNGKTFYRIQALKDFSNIKKGSLGGFVESERNLSQEDNCWIYGDAIISGDNEIVGDTMVFDINYIKKVIWKLINTK